jgi:hypothetical protein
MAFEPQETVCVFPGPEMADPPFPMICINRSDVAEWIGKGWTTEPPAAAEEPEDSEQPEDVEPKRKTKKK